MHARGITGINWYLTKYSGSYRGQSDHQQEEQRNKAQPLPPQQLICLLGLQGRKSRDGKPSEPDLVYNNLLVWAPVIRGNGCK